VLREVLGQARRRQRRDFGELLRPKAGESYPQTLSRAWSAMTGPAGRPYLDLFGRLRTTAEPRLWPGFQREATTDWLTPLAEGLESIGRPELATLVLAVIRGLIMDLEATSDSARTDRAFAEFLLALDPAAPRQPCGVRPATDAGAA
jgi:hypothetical protein